MKADRALTIETRRAWRAVVVLALLSGLAACSKGEPSGASASAPSPGAQATPRGAEPVAAVAIEKRATASKPSPDEALAATVRSRLTEAGLAALAVDIVSANGAITLYGTADSSKTRDQAARLAWSVEGVRSVANELVIIRGS